MTAEADQLQQKLLQAQNRDGGWAFQQGTSDHASSWTEPTASALLALAAHRCMGPAYHAGRSWLLKTQRPDGGWAPHPGVDTATSVTSVAVLALCQTPLDPGALIPGVKWVLKHENEQTPLLERLAFRLLGASPPKAPGGSPWFPGTAAWIAPTVMSVLALSRFANTGPPQAVNLDQLESAVKRAQDYILSRKCRDGGWNHGGSPFRSENAESYPEMTGMALLALKNAPPTELHRPLDLAEAFLSRPQPASAFSWLQLALLKHGRKLQVWSPPAECRNNLDICLRLLALAGSLNGVLPESLAT